MPRRDTTVGLFIAGKKATRENSTTRFVPESHLQASSEEGVVYAEMKPEDWFVMVASARHGRSANTTDDRERLTLAF